MACLGLALLALQLTMQDDLVLPPRQGMMSDALGGYGRLAVRIYKQDGENGLRNYLLKLQFKSHINAYLFLPDGRVFGPRGTRRAPADVRAVAIDVQASARTGLSDPKFALSSLNVVGAQPVPQNDGIYVLAGSLPRWMVAATRVDLGVRFLRVVVVLLITGLVCFALARYLATPVTRVRRAAQQIARGDLTARAAEKQARGRDELSGLTRDFDAMAERLEALVTAQTRLLGDVSHELRSPLARMNLALELARRGDATKKDAALDRIQRESARLEELIAELLTLSRLETGLKLREGVPLVNVAELARDVAADADFEAARRQVRVTLSTELESAPVRGDSELLRRAIENVARNAVRHTDEGSTVEMTLDREGDCWTLSIHDHGPGVPETEMASIFQPFYRVESARERSINENGTGLGLAIADRAARAHGGRIGARNALGGGLIVQIDLPVAENGRGSSSGERRNMP